jgi:cytoskeletal protein RodZ
MALFVCGRTIVSLGADLKRERELRGITLEEIARETKIRVGLLGYMEADRFDRLPSGIFRQSFVRSYARYLGIDEVKAVSECLLEEDGVSFTGPPARVGEATQASPPTRPKARTTGAKSATLLPSAVALLGALAIFYFVEARARTDQAAQNVLESRPTGQHSQDLASTPPPASRNQGQPLGVTGPGHRAALKVLGELAPQPSSESPAAAEAGREAEPRLRIKAREQAWVRVSAGENTLFSGILQSDETRSFSLQQPLHLKLGNPRGTQLWVNGQLFGQLSKDGKPKTIVVSAENYQRYLAVRESMAPSLSSPRLSTLN